MISSRRAAQSVGNDLSLGPFENSDVRRGRWNLGSLMEKRGTEVGNDRRGKKF